MNEREILTCCALRFNGWEYIEVTGFDRQEAFEQYFETRQWNFAPFEQLAMFFLLQRGLMKWDLEREPEHGKYWRAFRELFFLCVHSEIPEQYRSPEYCEEWERDYQPQLAACVQLIEENHRSTVYDENASPRV